MKKADIEKKKSLGRAFVPSGMEQTEIADKIGISRVTVSKWCSAEGWKEARAAKSITRPELVNKLLLTIDKLIEQVNASEDANLIAGLGDKLAKLSSVIEKLDKKANVWMPSRCSWPFQNGWSTGRRPTQNSRPTLSSHQQVPGQVYSGKHGHEPGEVTHGDTGRD